MDVLWQDLRLAVRSLVRSPGFTAIAIVIVALGIGANTAIFSVVNGVLLRPLAYRESHQLFLIQVVWPQMAKFHPFMPANLPGFRMWQRECRSFESMAIAEGVSATLTGMGEAIEIHGVRGSANLFDVIGVRPSLGRDLRPDEDEPGRGQVVILTDAFWRKYFRGDASVIGRTVTLDGKPYTIVGVLSESFHFPSQLGTLTSFGRNLDFFEPLNGPKDSENDLIGEFDFAAIGRLKAGVNPAQALAELNVVQARIATQEKDSGGELKAAIFPLESEVVGSARRGLILLLAAVGVLLLIVCVNLANLFLARMPGRMREAAIRTSLGATRWQLSARVVMESLVLGVVGGLYGVLIGSFGVGWLVRSATAGLPRLEEVQIDARVVLFGASLSLLTAVLFGALPAWRMMKSDPHEVLKAGGTATSESRPTRHLRETLVSVEVGLCTTLLIVAGLLTTSLFHVLRVKMGFATEGVLTVSVNLPPQDYAEPVARLHFYNTLVDRVRTLPGVLAAGWVRNLPLDGEGSITGVDVPPGRPVPPPANFRAASTNYFSAMGIPLLRGRIFDENDRGRKVVVISQSVAERFWPGQDPIGRTCLTFWGGKEEDEVIGVVSDVRTVKLDVAPTMMVYVPDWFGTHHLGAPQSAGIVVRTSGSELSVALAVREAIHATDPDVPIVAMRPMSELVSESVGPRRFQMLLVLLFAGCALLQASLGIYGVIAYSVEQRRQELGIRAAIGARSSDLFLMVIGQGMLPVVVGLAAGLGVSVVAGKLIQSLLFGVRSFDLITMLCVVFVIIVVGLASCYLPARRAMRLDPIVALRYE